jgi:hypothetical protein
VHFPLQVIHNLTRAPICAWLRAHHVECHKSKNYKSLIFKEWRNSWLKNVQLPPSALNTRAEAVFKSYHQTYPQKLWKTFLLWVRVGVIQS